jgi:hypothetical protein
MNASPPELAGWTKRRFWCLAGALFAAQAGLILLFAEGSHGASHQAPVPGHFRLLGAPLTADQLTKTFFATDPTVFPLPNLQGFSGRAWLRLPEQNFDMPETTEAPAWRTIDANRLGADFPPLHRADSPLPFGLADENDAELEPWPVSLTSQPIRTGSAFEIQGELAGRQLNPPTELRSWPSPQLLSNSVVQIAVDSAGQVVAAELLGRSGLTDADTIALDKVRSLRFRPSPVPSPVWGNAVFEWQTLEQTNSPQTGLP